MNKRFLVFLLVCVGLALLIQSFPNPPPAPPPQLEIAQYKTYYPIAATDGIKAGYAWPWFKERDKVDDTLVSWYYRHAPFTVNPYPHLEYIPMVHCEHQLSLWRMRYSSQYSGIVLWLNEPLDQCRLSPAEAVDFLRVFRRLCPHCAVYGPNLSNRAGNIEWMQEFMSYKPDIQGVGFHHYQFDLLPPSPTRWETFREQADYYCSLGLPVWVTEWGADTPEGVRRFREWFKEYEWCIKREAYFGPYIPRYSTEWWWRSRLFDEAGLLSDVGRAWVNR